MKALQFLQSERRLELREVPWPTISAPDDVVVRVSYAGVCGTDLHAMEGLLPMAQRWMTMGHELSGVVAEVGSAVTSCKVGDRVAVDPNKGCERCDFCKVGNVHFCPEGCAADTLGFWRGGGWAEATVAPERCVHRLPDELPLRSAALCEPLSCLIHALDLFGPAPDGSRVLVLGAGIIGVLVSCVLHHRGVRHVTVSEPAAARRRFVDGLQLGFRTVAPPELAAEMGALTPHQLAVSGLDVVIDCSGFCPAIEQAVGWLRMGGTLCVFGLAPPDGRISLSPNLLLMKELKVLGVLANPHTFPRATALAAALWPRYLGLEKLGVQVFTLDQYEEAMKKLKTLEISKAMFAIDESQK